MFGAFIKATNTSFQKGMTFDRSIYVTRSEIFGLVEVRRHQQLHTTLPF